MYLRCSLPSNNIETSSLSGGQFDNHTITSNIVGIFQSDHEFVHYDSRTDEFFSNLRTKELNHLKDSLSALQRTMSLLRVRVGASTEEYHHPPRAVRTRAGQRTRLGRTSGPADTRRRVPLKRFATVRFLRTQALTADER